jgi:hypothetical protein
MLTILLFFIEVQWTDCNEKLLWKRLFFLFIKTTKEAFINFRKTNNFKKLENAEMAPRIRTFVL